MANRNFSNGGKIFAMEARPALVQCSFQVASSDSGGLGIKNLKGPLVQNVFMHSSAATPSVLPGANPASGYIVIQLQDNYRTVLSPVIASIQSPNSGSDIKVDNSAMTVGQPYVITTLGNLTLAQWQSLGVPKGVTPAVGVAFVALLVGVAGEANTSTSRVQQPKDAGSGIFSVEAVGSSPLAINPAPSANQGYGGQIILACRNGNSSFVPTVTAPTDGSIISVMMYLSDSSVTVQGS